MSPDDEPTISNEWNMQKCTRPSKRKQKDIKKYNQDIKRETVMAS